MTISTYIGRKLSVSIDAVRRFSLTSKHGSEPPKRHRARPACTESQWTDPERDENVLSHFDTTLNRVFLSLKKSTPVFVLEELPHRQFEVPPELMHFYRLLEDNPSPEMEAIFIYEAFLGVFKYFVNDSFSSIAEYKTFSDEILREMKEIAEHINKVAKDVGISRIFGGLAGASGGIMCIVGLALTPVTLGASTVVSAVGVGVGLAGGLTSTGAWIAEEILKKTDKDSFQEKFEKFKNASEIIHAFAFEFLKKSSEAGLWKESRTQKTAEIMSSISTAFCRRNSIDSGNGIIKAPISIPDNVEKTGKLSYQMFSNIFGFVRFGKAIAKASGRALSLSDDVAKVGGGAVKTGLAAALTDDTLINISTGVASSVKATQVSSLAARSFTGALSSVGVVFSIADIVMGALQIKNKNQLASKLSENLKIVEEGNSNAINIYCELLNDFYSDS